MTDVEDTITFRKREFKGSRLRCLLLTNNAPKDVAAFLNSLVAPHALVTTEDHWAPRGFLAPDEAQLGKTPGFLPEADREVLTRWWLDQPHGANTPNWDLVSTCRIEGRKGVILAEAKAHEAEFSDDRIGATNPEHSRQFESATGRGIRCVDRIDLRLRVVCGAHYQLSNRFTFRGSWRR